VFEPEKSEERALMLCTPTVHKHAPGQRKQQLESGWIQSIVEKNEEKVQAPTCFFRAMDDHASGMQVSVLTAPLVQERRSEGLGAKVRILSPVVQERRSEGAKETWPVDRKREERGGQKVLGDIGMEGDDGRHVEAKVGEEAAEEMAEGSEIRGVRKGEVGGARRRESAGFGGDAGREGAQQVSVVAVKDAEVREEVRAEGSKGRHIEQMAGGRKAETKGSEMGGSGGVSCGDGRGMRRQEDIEQNDVGRGGSSGGGSSSGGGGGGGTRTEKDMNAKEAESETTEAGCGSGGRGRETGDKSTDVMQMTMDKALEEISMIEVECIRTFALIKVRCVRGRYAYLVRVGG